MTIPPLDLLIYAHDGRGLGHASRSIAVGMAMRRLFPESRVLFVSGCKLSAALIGPAPLEWIKLPSYRTKVIQGRSHGFESESNYTDAELGGLRARILRHLVRLYTPRCVLVDHSPQGKHRELLPALQQQDDPEIHWILGVRGVVGDVPQVRSELAQQTFRQHYNAIVWYGDTDILGVESLRALEKNFSLPPHEMGYVSRLSEWIRWRPAIAEEDSPAGTISIPWVGEGAFQLLRAIADTLRKIGDTHGVWRLFIGFADAKSEMERALALFSDMPFCRVAPAGDAYGPALLRSKTALIYGGYNSLMDVLWANTPAVVLTRGMEDQEQELHLKRLVEKNPTHLVVMNEKEADATALYGALTRQLREISPERPEINLNGAENTAQYLHRLINDGSISTPTRE